MTPVKITKREQDVLHEIVRLHAEGKTITTRVLSNLLHLTRQKVRRYVQGLEVAGLVTYQAEERHAAIIQATDQAWAYLDQPKPGAERRFPVLGEVAAGVPTHAEEYVEGYVARLTDLLELHEGDFLLRVRGESMTGIGIYPGDHVIIHPVTAEPRSGEIALVALPGEGTATLKRWQRHGDTVTLHSENPEHPPMTFQTTDVLVQGRLAGIIGSAQSRTHH